VVFCISFIVLALIGTLVTRFVRGTALTAIDRSLGFVFGIVRGALVVCLVYMTVVAIFWPDIDKPRAPPPPAAQQEAQDIDKNLAKPESKSLPPPPAPQLLMQAQTRPFLAFGAKQLKEFIPDDVLEKTTKEYLEQKDEAQKKLETQPAP
jgi:uncharacterized membrane protein required for colicin V production